MDELIEQLEQVTSRLDAPVVTMEELEQMEVPEDRIYQCHSVTLGGYFTMARLVRSRDGNVTVNLDVQIGRPELLQRYNEIRQQIGLILCEQHGIMPYQRTGE